MANLSASDIADLQTAITKLETQSLAMKIASHFGMPVEALLHLLPKKAHASVAMAVDKSLQRCLRVALKGGQTRSAAISHKRTHIAATAITGAAGGFFGLPGLILELPVTTTIMLHSIVEIARSQGEDLSNPESALSCIEVFALGPERVRGEAMESAYYATRTALAQITREAAAYIAHAGVGKKGGPAVFSLLGKIASRFGIEVSEKVAAELIPVAGAFGGLTLNVLFSRHFQSLAEGHFTIRRLERKYGFEAVRRDYVSSLPIRQAGRLQIPNVSTAKINQ